MHYSIKVFVKMQSLFEHKLVCLCVRIGPVRTLSAAVTNNPQVSGAAPHKGVLFSHAISDVPQQGTQLALG